ncbi:MAG TPA: peptidyl-prolyl cis-trans isomerase [Bryobacteraceae bacterium]|nr:peptidyl-prolyl cis-trans isomerase [Bryobacteraceae bacterium]
MFDLFRSRAKAVRYLLGALLGIVALSMVITMIPGFGAPSTDNQMIVAEVGKSEITAREVQALMQNLIRSRRVPPEMVQHYVPQLIDQMITERAVAYQAERMGFRVSDADVANAIRSMLPQLASANFDRSAYAAYLAQQGLTIEEFERNIRSNLMLLKLQNIALEGAIVTPAEVETEFHRKNDKVKVDYIAWEPKETRSEVTVSQADIEAYYNANRGQFMSPEKRSFHLLIADEARMGAAIEVSENDLRAAYSANLDRYRLPEKVKVRHILISTTGKSPEETAKLQAKAADILKQARGGADFAALAKQHSDDPGSKETGGEYEVVRGQMVPAFEQAAFSRNVKEIGELVKTEYGFHILQVLEKMPAKVKPFEEVKAELATERKRDAVYSTMQNNIDKARAELARAPQTAPQIAAKYNLIHTFVQNAAANSPIPEVGTSPELSATLAGLRQGEVSQVMQVAQNKLGVVAVTEVQASRPATLADIEGTIRETLINQKAGVLGQQRMQETMAKLKGMIGTGDLNAMAKAIGGTVKSTQPFTVEGAADGIGPATYLQEAFTKPVGSLVGPINIGAQVIVAKVAEKIVASPAELAAARDQLVISIKQRKAQERKELFEDGLLTQLIKEGKVKKNQETIKRLVTQYQG